GSLAPVLEHRALEGGSGLRPGRPLLEAGTRGVAGRDADEVALREEVEDPVAEHADLALPHRHREAVVATVHEPGEEALDRERAVLEDAVVQADARDRARVLVHV